MARKVEFTVIGEQTIHCAGCEQRIGNALKRLPGVEDARASAKTQHVVVSINPVEITPEQVRSRLELLGYEVAPDGGPQ
ncbi:MAG: heavy-metal-associated domain-containing protein [Ardenticatenaceae bacterium]|nr:heavy-metal-associated domain-containing protein [Ardenticatenaceae bacterium]HBY96206.1 copper resistance protein CopZ [Chloroflexota bacterium]